jgi:RHS repeat-associated protein
MRGSAIARTNRQYKVLFVSSGAQWKVHPGHVECVTDGAGVPYQYFHYSPWGESLISQTRTPNSTDFSTPYRFNAKELDSESGLFYYGARYYHPMVSKWLGVDPMASERSWLTPYNFVQNNPITRIDPDGRLDTKYIDEEGNLLLETNDGSQDIITVPNDKIEDFKYFGESYKNDGMKPLYDSKGWNDNMKAEMLGFETTNQMESVLGGFTRQWSRQKAINFLQNPSIKNAMAMSFSEALSQWTDAEKVMAGASIGAIGLLSMRNVVTQTSVGPIKGYTRHGLNQAISRNSGRGVHPSAIKDAALNPIKVIEQSGGRIKYVGKDATVILNSEGKVITTYGTPRSR